MLSLAVISAAAFAGFASIPHCMGMCGPLAAFACAESRGASLGYALGRLAGYALLGAAVGFGGEAIVRAVPAKIAGVVLAWSLALGLGLGAVRLWRAGDARGPSLVALRPRRDEGAPMRRARAPILVGLGTAVLPCGALLSAVLIAAGAGSVLGGALAMLAFALASSPGLFAVVAMARRLDSFGGRAAARTLAVALALGAVVLALRPIPSLRSAEPPCHASLVERGAP